MKRKIGMFSAVLGAGLLMATGSATAVPAEQCENDGQIGHSWSSEAGQNGWHVWECWDGNWQYRGYCGLSLCVV
ncbi:hypothetical protein [Luteimonas sp. FCS-9]|uniref:hypothetical protein n=1 Tax=Luteimonas sp. FCS-9 TaxID=1547516 RepID=UPI00063EC191|nr:hypothetical protein [Luteimonas sp. FCS-9]KLJ02810.1 hypothetical protein WQ56_00525 [Luteimonas sp. FCS-9]